MRNTVIVRVFQLNKNEWHFKDRGKVTMETPVWHFHIRCKHFKHTKVAKFVTHQTTLRIYYTKQSSQNRDPGLETEIPLLITFGNGGSQSGQS